MLTKCKNYNNKIDFIKNFTNIDRDKIIKNIDIPIFYEWV